ncbi:MAG: hypothetical protein QXD24_02090 [Candidatus Caldarchaeum sp.]
MPERASHGRHVEMCRACIEWLHISLDTLDRTGDWQKMVRWFQMLCQGFPGGCGSCSEALWRRQVTYAVLDEGYGEFSTFFAAVL